MVLRIVFTREDLQRLRIHGDPDPMWELILSLHHIQERNPATRYRDWHRQARDRIRAHDDARQVLGPLFTLVPREGSFPDFLTPAPSHVDVDAACEQIVCTRRDLLVPDLSAVFAGRRAPSWVRELATGDHGGLADVASMLRGAYDLLIRPHWPEISAGIAAERAERLRALSSDGIRGLFSGLPGVLGWDGEVLRVRYPYDRTFRLDGRGLTLVPSHFCWTNPVSLINPELPPLLVYPATAAGAVAPEAGTARRITALLGPNRADCLNSLVKPHSTSTLAARVGISISSASRQAMTLREAGLVVSERQGSAVVHRLSPLGAALLAGSMPEV